MKKQKITYDESILIEKSYYEYKSSLDILSYLMKQDKINENYLNQYLKKSEEYYIIFEETKQLIFNKYNLHLKTYNFDFNNLFILYDELKE